VWDGLDEEARCDIWLEAREERLSVGSVRGISAVISLLKEDMGEEDVCSGRGKVLKETWPRKAIWRRRERGRQEPWEAEKSNRKEDWVIATLAVMCYFGCRRLADVIRIKVGDVAWEDGTIRMSMKKL
jgi:hypothetical protein